MDCPEDAALAGAGAVRSNSGALTTPCASPADGCGSASGGTLVLRADCQKSIDAAVAPANAATAANRPIDQLSVIANDGLRWGGSSGEAGWGEGCGSSQTEAGSGPLVSYLRIALRRFQPYPPMGVSGHAHAAPQRCFRLKRQPAARRRTSSRCPLATQPRSCPACDRRVRDKCRDRDRFLRCRA